MLGSNNGSKLKFGPLNIMQMAEVLGINNIILITKDKITSNEYRLIMQLAWRANAYASQFCSRNCVFDGWGSI